MKLCAKLIKRNLKICILESFKTLKSLKNAVNKEKILTRVLRDKKFLGFFLVFMMINMLVLAETANAGIISFIEKIFTFNEEQVSVSQNAALMPLLQAAKNSDPSISKSQENINIVDQNAILANSGPMGTILDIKNTPSTQISIYTVREGDSLSAIAEMFNVDVNTIKFANDIKKGSQIMAGDSLVILPIPGVRYTVKKGDTLKLIAKKFGGDEDEISQFNDLDPKKELADGDTIIVPNGEFTGHIESAPAVPSAPKHGAPPTPKKKILPAAPNYAGYYLRPISGGVKTQGIHGYNGVDLAASCGEPIYAAAEGDVIISKSSGWNGGYGEYVVISHVNGTQTLYSHNSENEVLVGDHVLRGQMIGYIGETGHATGCHVHFEVRGAKNPF